VENLQWSDSIKNSIVLKPWQQFFAGLLNALSIQKVQTKAHYRFADFSYIRGTIKNKFFGVEIKTSVKFDPINGFNEIKINNYTLTNNATVNLITKP